jgi:hypothetical protein
MPKNSPVVEPCEFCEFCVYFCHQIFRACMSPFVVPGVRHETETGVQQKSRRKALKKYGLKMRKLEK